jgi:hypothetical protein
VHSTLNLLAGRSQAEGSHYALSVSGTGSSARKQSLESMTDEVYNEDCNPKDGNLPDHVELREMVEDVPVVGYMEAVLGMVRDPPDRGMVVNMSDWQYSKHLGTAENWERIQLAIACPPGVEAIDEELARILQEIINELPYINECKDKWNNLIADRRFHTVIMNLMQIALKIKAVHDTLLALAGRSQAEGSHYALSVSGTGSSARKRSLESMTNEVYDEDCSAKDGNLPDRVELREMAGDVPVVGYMEAVRGMVGEKPILGCDVVEDLSVRQYSEHLSTVETWEGRYMLITSLEKFCHDERIRILREIIEQVPYINEVKDVWNEKLLCHDYFYVASEILEIFPKIIEIHKTLLALAGRSQAEGSQHFASTTSTGGMAGKKRSAESATDAAWNNDRKRIRPLEQVISVANSKIVKNFKGDNSDMGDVAELDESHQKKLRSFCAGFDAYFDRATIFNKKNKPSKETYQQALINLEDKLGSGTAAAESIRENCIPNLSAKNDPPFLIPGPLAKEVPHVQPYLTTLLQWLAKAADEVDVNGNGSPAKSDIKKERMVPRTEQRPKRAADMSIAANTRFLFLLRDDSVEIAVEEKAGESEDETPEMLLVQAMDQCLSHLAKHLGIAFDFVGKGIDARATGVILTAVYVKIVQLRLVNVGTTNTNLVQL